MAKKAPPIVAAFLADILAHPDDDAPRLIFADWLDEHGDPDRADFIRVQCRLAGLDEDDPDRAALVVRSDELEKAHGPRWLAEVPKVAGVTFAGFERGFVGEARVALGRWTRDRPRRVAALYAAGPFRELTLDDATPDKVTDLLTPAAALRLTKLEFFDISRPLEVTRRIAASPHVRNLTALEFFDLALDDDWLAVVAGSPHLANLARLFPVDCGPFGVAGVRALAESPHLTRLTGLYLHLDGTAVEACGVLAEAASLATLRELDLAGYLGPDGLGDLSRSPHLLGLRELGLHGTGLGDSGMQVLAGSRWRSMRGVDLSMNQVGDGGARALASWAGLATVRNLQIRHNAIGPAGVAALATSPYLSRLEELHLANNPVGHGGVSALVAADLPRLRELNLWHCEVGDDGVRRIADSPSSARLTKLTLANNAISDEGAQALLRSPHLGGITRLEILGNALSARVIDALKRRFGDVWV